MVTSGSDGDWWQRPWVWTVAVLLLAVLPFAPSLGNGFAMDDEPLASSDFKRQPGTPDPMIAELKSPGFYFGKSYWYPEYINDGLYRPVTIYSYALVYAVLGKSLAKEFEAFPQHLTNLLLHAVTTLLVLLLLRLVGMGQVAAHIGAGCFAVHAIHSEVVAGIVGRAELLAAAFGLGAILLFVRALGSAKGSRYAWFVVASVLLFLSYGSKESGLANAPFLLCVLLAVYWTRRKEASGGASGGASGSASGPELGGAVVSGVVVALVPLVCFLVLRHGVMTDPAQPRVEAIDYVTNPLYHADFVTRICTAVKMLGYGLYKCIVPLHLSANYGAAVFDLEPSFFGLWVVVSFVALAAFLLVGLRYARRVPALFLGMACFLGFSFITSNIPLAIGTFFAERLYYMPSLGVCILAGLAVEKFRSRRVLLGALAIWAVGNIAIAWPRNFVWKDTPTLFLAEAEAQPDSADMLVKAAGMLRLEIEADPKHGDQALEYVDRALQLVPGYPHALREKAAIHIRRQEYDAALAAAQAAIDSEYGELEDAKIYSYNTIVNVLVLKGDKAGALRVAEATLRIDPLDGVSWVAIAEHGPGTLGQSKLLALFSQGVQVQRRMPQVIGYGVSADEVGLHLGIMGEKIKANAQAVYALLERCAQQLAPERRKGMLFAEALFCMATAKVRAGQPEVARGILQKLLDTPTLPPALRPRVASALANLGR